VNKLRFQHKLRKLAEQNQTNMMIEDYEDELLMGNLGSHDKSKIKWYLIDSEGTFCQVWNFVIAWATIYSLIMVPFILTFPDVYQEYHNEEWVSVTPRQNRLKTIEKLVDVVFFIDIIFNFVKRTISRDEIFVIAKYYITHQFAFDVVSTIPLLIFLNENFAFYWLKCARVVHIFKLTSPLELLLKQVLQKYSKKRQSDLTGFCNLILFVVYLSHILACIWLQLGGLFPCKVDSTLPYNIDSADADVSASN
jgi:hypothetical protein